MPGKYAVLTIYVEPNADEQITTNPGVEAFICPLQIVIRHAVKPVASFLQVP
jgi:hypothetical protein